MLNDATVIATLAVRDLEQAKKFYGDKLGLKMTAEEPGGGGVTYQSGNGQLFVYSSEDNAGKNPATSATWDVDNLKALVDDLKGKDISFEHYDMPDVTVEGDIHSFGPVKAAWFKDPDGNILALLETPKAT